MTAPPFPVPRGMDWDPVKKRFFRKVPAKAKVESQPVLTRQISEDEQEDEATSQVFQSPLLHATSISLARRVRIGHLTSRSSLPFQSLTKRRVEAVAEEKMGQLKHVATTSLIPWRLQGLSPAVLPEGWEVRIHHLESSSSIGALLFFSSGDGSIYYLDTSHIRRLERTSAFAPCKYLSGGSGLANLQSWSDHLLSCGGPSSSNIAHSFCDDYMIRHVDTELLIEKYARIETPPYLHLTDRFLVSTGPCKEIQHLSLQVLPTGHSAAQRKRFLVTYASHRRVEILYLQCGEASESQLDCRRGSFMTKSDVICMALLPCGEALLVGLRNGKILVVDRDMMLKQVSSAPSSSSAATNSQTGKHTLALLSEEKYLPSLGNGAVTHIKSVSAKEVIVAYSSGEVVLVHVPSGKALMRYHGHVNSWSLDLPMCLDLEYRLFALAGQDRKVRIWSLDHPLPLQNKCSSAADVETLDLADRRLSTKPLHEVIFSAPVTGLTFCQRRYVANLEPRYGILPRGLPALAVSCGGNQIAFFE